MADHRATQEQNGGHRRWVCPDCWWSTEWTTYTEHKAAAAAIRHQLDHRSEANYWFERCECPCDFDTYVTGDCPIHDTTRRDAT